MLRGHIPVRSASGFHSPGSLAALLPRYSPFQRRGIIYPFVIFVNKKAPEYSDAHLLNGKLFLLGSTYGAVIGTGTAFDALFGIDFELSVALFDRLYRAISSASSAANASISNLVCHFFVPP